MVHINLFLLAACFLSTLGKVGGTESTAQILDTCHALKQAAEDIRQEGYSAIDKADKIREQAYQAKDEAYEMKECSRDASCGLETTLVETLVAVQSQTTANKLYIHEMRNTLTSLTNQLERLEQEQIKNNHCGILTSLTSKLDDMQQDIEDRIDEKTALISEKLLLKLHSMGIIKDKKKKSGELIPADKVEQSSTWRSDLGAKNAVDADPLTESHTLGDTSRQWFRYIFSEEQAIGRIKVINGVRNDLKYRLNGAKVYAMITEVHRRVCRDNTVIVREGDSVQDQTYFLDCTGNSGIGVEFVLDTGTYLEFGEIEVYAP